jgi:hypothetical protein
MWAILIVTLPTQPNAVRLRIWRALRSLGCVALRDGAFLLPLSHAAALESLAAEVREHGGTASVLILSPRDSTQRDEVLAQFDRAENYARWRETATALQEDLKKLRETEARRRLRGVADALQALRRIDYYPGEAAEQAEAVLMALRQALDTRFSRGEPHTRTGVDMPRLDRAKFQGRRWATRARPWVDRLACAWLIRRFIDPKATFITFEVLAASFGLDADPQLRRIAQAVHYLDIGGIPVPEAAGLETVLGGLRELHANDGKLVVAAASVFDALYAAPGASS